MAKSQATKNNPQPQSLDNLIFPRNLAAALKDDWRPTDNTAEPDHVSDNTEVMKGEAFFEDVTGRYSCPTKITTEYDWKQLRRA